MLARFSAMSIYSLTFSPSSPNPFSQPPSFPPARRDDRGCFAFVAWEKGDRILLLPSCSPLPSLGEGLGVRAGVGEGLGVRGLTPCAHFTDFTVKSIRQL
ncbi:hypothetical protein MC7420_1804 [Coleofasciculus chthonoplastes PCC 7420]|uniref:Uncharacterized protein n=1 Tax=Coleofasciculus chthonoplastes PCC 7420 TaxID=118168 RepID=B4VMQ1_9CYAN|nr:hypothetical protein MC7420_1804 [Coleofasciculus chthonoplastes PCC 7420]